MSVWSRLSGWMRQRTPFAAAFMRGDDVDAAAASRQMLRPYEQSAWVMRALNLIAGEIRMAPVKFYDGDVELDETKFLDWWTRPFIGQGGRGIDLEDGAAVLSTWLGLEGEYFIILGDEWLVSPGRLGTSLGKLLIARPDRMRHVVRGGELLGWVFTDAAGRQHELLPEQVIHQKLFNPYDDWRGLAPVKSVMMAAEGDYLAGLYVRNLMRNNGDQGVYVIGKSGVIDDPQKEQIAEILRAKRAARLRGEFRPVFLTGDIAIEDAKAQAPDANLQATRLQSRHEIFIGLGVPASMADIKAAYSIGSASDRYQLITGTCMSQGQLVAGPLGSLASMQTGRTLTAEPDWDNHPVMVDVRRERLSSADGLWNKGMPMQAVNEYLDLGMAPFPGWERGYLPFSVVEVSGSDGGLDDPALQEEPVAGDEPVDEDPDVAKVRLLLYAKGAQRRRLAADAVKRDQRPEPAPAEDFTIFACDCCTPEHGPVEMLAGHKASEREAAEWRAQMLARREVMKGYESRIRRTLYQARAETLAKIAANYTPTKKVERTVARTVAADLIFSLAQFSATFAAELRKQGEVALEKAVEQLLREVGYKDPWSMPPQEVIEFLRTRQNRITGASENIFQQIQGSLEEGIFAGDTQKQLADRVRAEFNGISQRQARTIASTETAAAYGAGRERAMTAAGVQYKRWLTSGNSNVRAAHAAANGQTVPVDQPYVVDGEQLRHPGDPNGSPGNVINCHCVSVPTAKAPEA